MKYKFTPLHLVAVALLFPVLLSAQEEESAPRLYVGPSIGYELYDFKTSVEEGQEEITSSVDAPTIAMSALFELSDHIAFQGRAGLQKTKFATSRPYVSPEVGSGTRRWHYVNKTFTLETSLRYAFTSTASGPFLEAGFRGGVPVKSRIRRSFTINGDTETEMSEDLTGFDYGLTVGAGYRIGDFELRLQASANDRAGYEGSFKYQQVGAQATYRFAMKPLH